MSEALAGSSTILPRPGQQRIPRIRVATAPRPAELGTRYLALLSALAVIVGLTFQSNLPDILRFSWIFAVALFSGYRSFRLATQKEGIALLAAFLTAGTVAFGAFGMVTYLNNQGSAYIAVVLAFAWYAWQGLTVHTLADSLNWRIVFEYGLFAVICVYLIVLAILTGRAL